jgi:hypothetical protein
VIIIVVCWVVFAQLTHAADRHRTLVKQQANQYAFSLMLLAEKHYFKYEGYYEAMNTDLDFKRDLLSEVSKEGG